MRTMIWKSIATLIPCFVMLVGIMPISALAATMEDNVVGRTITNNNGEVLENRAGAVITTNEKSSLSP